jgi:hypothetical protein
MARHPKAAQEGALEMTATKDIETLCATQDLPMELARLISSTHERDEPRVASMVSGVVAARQEDDVICPLMLRRNQLIPAHDGSVTQSGWRVE